MKPNDDTQNQDARGQITPPTREYLPRHQQAAANLTRTQIDTIYQAQYADIPEQESAGSVAASDHNPYNRTHSDAHTTSSDQWQQYHSAWQDYYQKYYGHYYHSAYQKAHSELEAHAKSLSTRPASPKEEQQEEKTLSKQEAINSLRDQLVEKAKDKASTVRKSRHFVPIAAGFAVLLIFVFVQYNSNLIAFAKAYTSPGNIEPQNIIADPNLSVEVGPEPRLIIPKINVDVAVNYNATTTHQSQMEAMRTGVAYFGIPGANSKPGQLGNVPIAGHSSNDFTAAGQNEVKFIFARLEQMQKGDIFYLNYEGTRYTYTIFDTKVVKPSEVNQLQVGTDKPYATLITCTPLGTAEKRFLAFAEQVSPSPSGSQTAPEQSQSSTSDTEMAGKSPTLFERMFGAN